MLLQNYENTPSQFNSFQPHSEKSWKNSHANFILDSKSSKDRTINSDTTYKQETGFNFHEEKKVIIQYTKL